MTASKQKGTAGETKVLRYLHDQGYGLAHRNPPGGSADVGDIGGVAGLAIEVKNCKAITLAQWVDEAVLEAENAEKATNHTHFGVVWHHRPRKGDPSEWYVTMRGQDFLQVAAPYTGLQTKKRGWDKR